MNRHDPTLGTAMAVRIKARHEKPVEVFDERASVDHLVWSLENNLDDLIEGHSKHPEYVGANRKRLFRTMTRLELLCSVLESKEAAE